MADVVQVCKIQQTQNEKYQKYDGRGENQPIYSIGLAGVPELAGHTVRVTIEVID